jgi:feruloyl esterase
MLAEHCRVAAVLTPSSDSHIEMEVWLPTENWNGKFQAVGNGGWAGVISYPAMASALHEGYATASNDTGHKGGTGEFALGHPEKVVDFAYRAMHEMTLKSKAIVSAFYEGGPRLSYYNGCSTGGRQGLMEAQRYPDDFDAIVAGAPVYNHLRLHAAQMSRQIEALKDETRNVPREKIALLANAVLAACDVKDGVKDNIVGEPETCDFDPLRLLCKAGDGPDCLTAPQVESARKAYAAVRTKAGELVYPGSSYGFELGWRMPQGGAPPAVALDSFRYLGHQDATWNGLSFELDRDLALVVKNAGFIDAIDPNLAKFKARGGKLLLYHGWADPGPAPANTIRYYSDVIRTLGPRQDNWMRLFLLPGVGHCGGGAGPDQADFVGAVERWRESGAPPDHITASHVSNNRVDMTRPLCPYPQVAQFKGAGSTNDAVNFECRVPKKANATN